MDNPLCARLPWKFCRIRCGCDEYLIPTDLLMNSEVLRKLYEGSVIEVCPSVLAAVKRMCTRPSTLAEFLEVAHAADFLCSDIDACSLVYLLQGCAVGEFRLQDACRAYHDSYTEEVESVRDVVYSRDFLTKALYEDIPDYMNWSGSDAPVKRRRSSTASHEEPANTTLGEVLYAYELVLGLGHGSEGARSICVEVLLAILQGLHYTPKGCAELIKDIDRLNKILPCRTLKRIIRKACMSLCAVERAHGNVFVNAETMNNLQKAYLDGRLELQTILPVESNMRLPRLYLLPCSPGRRDVKKVVSDTEVFTIAGLYLPWLPLLWELCAGHGLKLYLTGSFLTACIQNSWSVVPGDVDLFTPNDSHLPKILELLEEALWKTGLNEGMEKLAVTKRKIRLIIPKQEGPGKYVDLYAHPLNNISNYHISCVRAAYDGVSLVMTPSACIAFATGYCVDYNLLHRRDRAFTILMSKWKAGFSLIVNYRELVGFIRRVFEELSQLTNDETLSSRYPRLARLAHGETALKSLELYIREEPDIDVFSAQKRWRSDRETSRGA